MAKDTNDLLNQLKNLVNANNEDAIVKLLQTLSKQDFQHIMLEFKGQISANVWWKLLNQGQDKQKIELLLANDDRYTKPVILQALIKGNQQQCSFARKYLLELSKDFYDTKKLITALTDQNLKTDIYHKKFNNSHIYEFLTNEQLLSVIENQQNDCFSMTQCCLKQLAKCYPTHSDAKQKFSDQFYLNLIAALADSSISWNAKSIQQLQQQLLNLDKKKLSELIKNACLRTKNIFLQNSILLKLKAYLQLEDKIQLLANRDTVEKAYPILARDIVKPEDVMELFRQILVNYPGSTKKYTEFRDKFYADYFALHHFNNEVEISNQLKQYLKKIDNDTTFANNQGKLECKIALWRYIQASRLMQQLIVPWYIDWPVGMVLVGMGMPLIFSTFIVGFLPLILLDTFFVLPELVVFLGVLASLIVSVLMIVYEVVMLEYIEASIKQYVRPHIAFPVAEKEWDEVAKFKQKILIARDAKELSLLPSDVKVTDDIKYNIKTNEILPTASHGQNVSINNVYITSKGYENSNYSFQTIVILNKHQHHRYKLWRDFYKRNKSLDISKFKSEIPAFTIKLAKSFLQSAEQFGGDKKTMQDLRLLIQQANLFNRYSLFSKVSEKKFDLLSNARKQLKAKNGKLAVSDKLDDEQRSNLTSHRNWFKWATPFLPWAKTRSAQLYDDTVQLLNSPS